jgi:membrane associated rhomboid family serine protease
VSDHDDHGGGPADEPASEPMLRCSRCEQAIPVSQAIEAPVGYQCRDCAKGAVPARRLTDAVNHAPVTRAVVYTIVGLFIVSRALPESIQAFGLRPVLVGPGGPAFLDAIASWYTASPVGAAIGEPWLLITSAFLHANFMHIGFNGLLLWQLGHMLEPRLGRNRFIALYAAGLAGGGLGVVALAWVGALTGGVDGVFGSIFGGNPFQITIGASGAVFGLMGAAMVGMRERGINPWRTSIGTLVLLNLALTFFIPNISVGGHVGGLLGGWLAARFLFVPREEATRGTRIVSGLVVAMLALAIAFSALIPAAFGA